jgi:hypothetical protein
MTVTPAPCHSEGGAALQVAQSQTVAPTEESIFRLLEPVRRAPDPRLLSIQQKAMTKLLTFFGMTIGGWIGWALGEPMGMFAAFILSIVGTGAGLYFGRKIANDYF